MPWILDTLTMVACLCRSGWGCQPLSPGAASETPHPGIHLVWTPDVRMRLLPWDPPLLTRLSWPTPCPQVTWHPCSTTRRPGAPPCQATLATRRWPVRHIMTRTRTTTVKCGKTLSDSWQSHSQVNLTAVISQYVKDVQWKSYMEAQGLQILENLKCKWWLFWMYFLGHLALTNITKTTQYLSYIVVKSVWRVLSWKHIFCQELCPLLSALKWWYSKKTKARNWNTTLGLSLSNNISEMKVISTLSAYTR